MPSRPHITLEEHFLSTEASDTLMKTVYSAHPLPQLLVEGLDVTVEQRVADMDAGHVSVQVVSHVAGPLHPYICRRVNNEAAAIVRAAPDRLAAFAVLPVHYPTECPEELQSCVRDLGFRGALIDCRASGTYYDAEAYLPMWAKAEELGVPIYLHPTLPSGAQGAASFSPMRAPDGGGVCGLGSKSFDDNACLAPGTFGWGWHSDTALSVLRLYAAGIFDRFPRLRIILGHFGEMIPYMLGRIDFPTSIGWGVKRPFSDVWNTNIWVTTSGVWGIDPMATLLRNTRIDRIMYSVDTPFNKHEQGLQFMRDLEESGLVTPEGMDRIAYKNAEELLGLRVSKTFD